MQVNCIILAGGAVDERLRARTEVNDEALIPIGQHIMVEYVVGAMKNSNFVKKIALVGPVEQLKARVREDFNIVLVPGGETVARSVVNGLAVLPPSEFVLVASGDIPLINTAAVKWFIEACMEAGEADFYYPIVERSLSESKFPGAHRTYINFVEGSFTGGNVFLMRPEIVESRVHLADELISLRKDPVGLCKTIGPGFILKFLLRRLTIQEAEEKFSQLLGFKGVAVKCIYPEIGMDVDKPSDLDLVEQVLLGSVT
ncbi:MAG TPA: NTP transferase domain-containing protein [Clostridia bacterium]|nr:NTP transferase domain-containing protein [Clostridia bacterium]